MKSFGLHRGELQKPNIAVLQSFSFLQWSPACTHSWAVFWKKSKKQQGEWESLIFHASSLKRKFQTNGFVIILGLYLSITFLFLLPLVVGNGRILMTIYGIMWSVAMNFIIFACHTGHGGAINSFLSSKFWTAISKMILSIYLTATAIHGMFSIKSAPTSSTITASEFVSKTDEFRKTD